MKKNNSGGIFSNLKSDLPASVVVFFVALPLCLGIALASGAPLFSGLIAGIVGGIVVGTLSGSQIGVSGPAAGLAAIVLTAIGTLGGYENFLLAVVLGGVIQLIFGFLKAGIIGLETLLCVEATDKLDPEKRVTPTNRELLAQGTGNILSGMIGGLPITQVIVRSSANIQSGGKSKVSAIIHGFFLLISVVLIPGILNMIPLSVLAAILLIVGFKLAKPQLFKVMYDLGWKQFLPFIVTVLGIIFTDLLVGIGLGLAVGIVVILIKSFQNSHFLHIVDKSNGKHRIKMTLAEEVTFFNKGAILKELDQLPNDSFLELDVTKTRYLDNDIIEILDDFNFKARNRNIDVKLISERGIVVNPDNYLEFFKLRPKRAISLN
ncbi:UNVERIFIED_CONTAM: hypothetical protein GTU68_014917 [Idotea baltica]|nr:hypothetical protein [Idotea baltica]